MKVLVVAAGQMAAVALDAALGLGDWAIAGTISAVGSPAESIVSSTTEVRVLNDGPKPTVASLTAPTMLPASEVNLWAATVLDATAPETVEIAIDLPLHKLRCSGALSDEVY